MCVCKSACVCVCVCWAVKGELLWYCSSSVCTREWERDPDVKLGDREREGGVDGGIRADVIRESWSACQLWLALAHMPTRVHTSAHTSAHLILAHGNKRHMKICRADAADGATHAPCVRVGEGLFSSHSSWLCLTKRSMSSRYGAHHLPITTELCTQLH